MEPEGEHKIESFLPQAKTVSKSLQKHGQAHLRRIDLKILDT